MRKIEERAVIHQRTCFTMAICATIIFVIKAISRKVNQLFIGSTAVEIRAGSIKRTFIKQMLGRRNGFFLADRFKKIVGSGAIRKGNVFREKENGKKA